MGRTTPDVVDAKDSLVEAPPPPYSETNAPTTTATGSASSAAAHTPRPSHPPDSSHALQQVPPPLNGTHIRRQFPPAFSMYREGWGQRHYAIGEHQSSALYAVSLHSGWSGQPDVVLHNGPSETSPPLAAAERASTFSRSATITMPSLSGGSSGAAEETLEHTGGLGHGTQSFSIETGASGRRETFEWRHSHGNEVNALGGRGSGWKLVRLATDAPAGLEGNATFVGGGPTSSDGKEVVAVWSWASMSMSKVLRFQFLGSGANGALGERWAVMAVVTALRIWDRERRARNSANGGGGGGGG